MSRMLGPTGMESFPRLLLFLMPLPLPLLLLDRPCRAAGEPGRRFVVVVAVPRSVLARVVFSAVLTIPLLSVLRLPWLLQRMVEVGNGEYAQVGVRGV